MNKQQAMAFLAEAEDVAVGIEEERLEAAFGAPTPITVQASYHVVFHTHGRQRDAYVEYDDRGTNHHWFIFGHVSEEIQNAKYATSSDAIAAIGEYAGTTQEVEVTV